MFFILSYRNNKKYRFIPLLRKYIFHSKKTIMKIQKVLLVFTWLMIVSVISFAQSSFYLKIDGIDGDSKDKTHDKWTVIEGFSLSIFREAPQDGRRAGQAEFSTINVFKTIDISSVKISEAVAKGTAFKKVEIHCTTRGAKGVEVYYSYELTNAIIVSYSISGNSGDEPPIEELTFSFDTIKTTYNPAATGSSGGKVEYLYDVKKGQ